MAFAKAISFICDGQSMIRGEGVTLVTATRSVVDGNSADVTHAAGLLLTAAMRRRTGVLASSFDSCKSQGNASIVSNAASACALYTAALLARPSPRERAIALANRSAAWHAAGFPDYAVEDAVAAILASPMYAKAWFRLSEGLGRGAGHWSDVAGRLAEALLHGEDVSATKEAFATASALVECLVASCGALAEGRERSVAATLTACAATSRSTYASGCATGDVLDVRAGSCGRELCVRNAADAPVPAGGAGGVRPGDLLLREMPLASIATVRPPQQRDWLTLAAQLDSSAGGKSSAPSQPQAWFCSECLRPLPLVLVCSGACRAAASPRRPSSPPRPWDPPLQRATGCTCVAVHGLPFCIPCSGGCDASGAAAAWCGVACMLKGWVGAEVASGAGRHQVECQSGGAAASPGAAVPVDAWGRNAAVFDTLPAEVILALRCMAAADAAAAEAGLASLEGLLDPATPARPLPAAVPFASALQSLEAELPAPQRAELAVTAALTAALFSAAAATSPPVSATAHPPPAGAPPLCASLSAVRDVVASSRAPPLPPCPLRLARWLGILACNVHGVKALVPAPAEGGGGGKLRLEPFTEATVGLALYRTASLANHACVPTALPRFDGRVLELVALRRIPPGGCVTISYGPAALSEPDARKRQAWLGSRYAFACRCAACRAEPAPSPATLAAEVEQRRLFDRARAAAVAGDITAAVAAQRAYVAQRQVRLELLLHFCSPDREEPHTEGGAVLQLRPHAELADDLACLSDLAQELLRRQDAGASKESGEIGWLAASAASAAKEAMRCLRGLQ